MTFGEGHEMCRLDGRYSILDKRDSANRLYPSTTATVPLRKGVGINIKYVLTDGDGYDAHISVHRWGISTL